MCYWAGRILAVAKGLGKLWYEICFLYSFVNELRGAADLDADKLGRLVGDLIIIKLIVAVAK